VSFQKSPVDAYKRAAQIIADFGILQLASRRSGRR
jgi:hypothetical protein